MSTISELFAISFGNSPLLTSGVLVVPAPHRLTKPVIPSADCYRSPIQLNGIQFNLLAYQLEYWRCSSVYHPICIYLMSKSGTEKIHTKIGSFNNLYGY